MKILYYIILSGVLIFLIAVYTIVTFPNKTPNVIGNAQSQATSSALLIK